MPQPIDLQAQTIYLDLLANCTTPVFDGRGLSFTRKKIKNNEYWYLNVKLGKTAIQKYIGPCDQSTEKLIEQEKSFWSQSSTSEKQQRARLVDMFLAGGGLGLSHSEAKVLTLLERTGVFLAGGVLVGTPAFRALGNNLGVRWQDDYRTKDLDLAADHRYPLALKDNPIDVAKLLLSAEVGAIEVPALNPKHPSTKFIIKNQDYVVDILAPELGKPAKEPVFISQFNTYATPLRFLDYLLEDIEPAVIPHGIGILINVPNPARFALHKLAISQRRISSQAIKSKKDLSQAAQILGVLLENRPGSVLAAFDAVEPMGPKFLSQLQTAVKLLPAKIQGLLKEWISL